jgi:lipopolysaccharide export system permease protein
MPIRMPIIEIYIFRRILIVSMAALTVTTGMALTTQLLGRIDFLTSTGQSMLTFVILALLLIPPMIVVVMPFALLIGVLQTLRAMNQNAELAVLEASGSSTAGRARPALVLGVLATLFCLVVSIWIEPAASRQFRELITRASGDLLSAAIQSGGFKRVDNNLVLQIAEKRSGGEFGGIFVQDSRDPASHITYIAKSGALVTQDGKTLLVVREGEIQRKNTNDNTITFIRFDTYSLDASTFSAPNRAGLRATEQSTAYLFQPDADDPAYQKAPAAFRAELNRRFADGFYCLALVMVALFFTANARSNRQETGAAVAQAAAVGFALRGAGFGVTTNSGDSIVLTIMTFALPLGTTLLFGMLMWRGARGDYMLRLGAQFSSRLSETVERLRARIGQRQRPAA